MAQFLFLNYENYKSNLCKKKYLHSEVSPNSWGNSSQITATDILTPDNMLSEKAAPIERPSIKLWRPSPNIIIHATVPIVDCPFSKCIVCSWWWVWWLRVG